MVAGSMGDEARRNNFPGLEFDQITIRYRYDKVNADQEANWFAEDTTFSGSFWVGE